MARLSARARKNLDIALANPATGKEIADAIDGVSDQTFADGTDITFGSTTGTKLGTAAAEKLGFHGATPTAQRAGADQAAVATTAPTNSSPYGFSQAQATAIIALLNEIRAALVAKGIIKGSA